MTPLALLVKRWLGICPPHNWRRLTAENAYGTWTGPWRSKFWGGYHGIAEEACLICGLKRRMQTHDAWEAQVQDAQKALQRLIESEPT